MCLVFSDHWVVSCDFSANDRRGNVVFFIVFVPSHPLYGVAKSFLEDCVDELRTHRCSRSKEREVALCGYRGRRRNRSETFVSDPSRLIHIMLLIRVLFSKTLRPESQRNGKGNGMESRRSPILGIS